MEEEDDDFYGPNEGSEAPNGDLRAPAEVNGRKDVKTEEGLESGEEGEEEESSDSDVDIITERKDGPAAEPTPQPPRPIAIKPELKHAPSAEPTPRSAQPSQTTHRKTSSSTGASQPAAPARLKDGSQYPAIRTSSIDVNADPIYPPVGKPISQIEFDKDLAEHSKPWRLPGADQSEWFNYGFDEFTWAQYQLKQKEMRKMLEAQKAENEQFQMAMGSLGGPSAQVGTATGAPMGPAGQQQPHPGGPGAVPGMPGMPGMGGQMAGMGPQDEAMMSQMMATMMAQNLEMNEENFARVWQQMFGGGGAVPPQGPGAAVQAGYGGQQGYGSQGQWGQQQGGYGRGGRGGRRY